MTMVQPFRPQFNGYAVTTQSAKPYFGKVDPGPVPGPSTTATLLEGLNTLRAAAEWMSPAALVIWKTLLDLPSGDGHTVMLMPGFLGSKESMLAMKLILTLKNYKVEDALPKGFNRPDKKAAHLDELERQLLQVYEKKKNGHRKISVIGWSKGGMQERELAKMHPDKVRNVISMGSPIGVFLHEGTGTIQGLGDIHETMTKRSKVGDDPLMDRVETAHEAPPGIPTTAIYSRFDGVVNPLVAIQEEGDMAQNVEVLGTSHMGFPFDWRSIYVTLSVLAHPEGEWKPFDRSKVPLLLRPNFPEPLPVN